MDFDDARSDVLRRLAAGTVHDVNNLLVVVIGCAELALDDDSLSPRVRQLMQEIVDVGERASSLTQQFLSLRLTVAPTSVVDVAAVVRSARPLLDRLAGADITLRVGLGESPHWVVADARQIEQIVVNLAVNARDAMPAGGTLTVDVATVLGRLGDPSPGHSDLLAQPVTRITVSDTGAGVDPAVRERMFDDFVSTKGRGKNFGLGLAVVRTIVDQLGGAIHVATALGQGTTFAIDLPQAPGPESYPGAA